MKRERDISNFKHHVNNAGEIISAEHVNDLGKAINTTEKNVIDLSDENFSSKVLFTLEHHSVANASFLDKFENPYKIFASASVNTIFSDEEKCVHVGKDDREGILQSIRFTPKYETPITEVMLMVDHYIPRGGRIDYFISVDGNSFFPLKPNEADLTKMLTAGTSIFVKARMVKNRFNESPKIYGWGILYRDIMIENLYGLKDLDLSRFTTNLMGDTVLVRDRHNEDKLVMVITPGGLTELHYDAENDNRLDHVIDREGDRVMKQTMTYGEYFNSQGKFEELLLGTSAELISEEPKDGKLPSEYEDRLDKIFEEMVTGSNTPKEGEE